MERPQNPIKIVFLRWSSKNVKKQKMDFLATIAWHYLCQEGRKTRIFVHTICFGQIFWPKQCKPGKTINIVLSAEIAQNQKWHLFFEKGVFRHGWKVGFTNCVFEKTENICHMKNSGLFLNMAKWCFLGLFFSGFSVIVVCFGVFGIVPGVLKMLVFPFFGLLWGGLFLLILGLEGLGVFVFLVFVFVFCVAFVSVLFALFLFCCWIVFGVGSCFAFVFVFFCFVFFVLFFFVFLEGLRVRWGGPKGHLTWP